MKHKSAEWLLLVAVCVLAFAVMFGHVTAVKNIALGVAVIGLLAVALMARPGRVAGAASVPAPGVKRSVPASADTRAARVSDQPRVWPTADVVVPMVLWLLWAAASLAWSADAKVSLLSWLDEIVYPFIGFLAFYRIAIIAKARPAKSDALKTGSRQQEDEEADRPRHAFYVEASVWFATLLLAALSLYGLGQLQPESPHVGLLHYYERVGHTSTFAIIVLPLFIAMTGRVRTRLAGLSGIVLALVIGASSLNRFFIASAAVVLVVGMWPTIRRHKAVTCLAAVVLIFGGVATMLYSTVERAQSLSVGSGAAPRLSSSQILDRAVQVDGWEASLTEMAKHDTRPMIWSFYGERVSQHPWLGIGFGKPLPGLAYSADMPPALVRVEPAAKTHAHDLFLNTVLQVGIVGLALQCLMLLSWLRAFVKAVPGDPWIRSAGIALILGVVSKNLTDDFLWQSTMLAFWAHAGWLMGRARLSAHLTHRASSGRTVAMRRLRRVGN